MKLVKKSAEPISLTGYRDHNPGQNWDGMSNDGLNDGPLAVKDCRRQALTDQGGLCAYCECKIDVALPGKCRVEHFHPKSDTSTATNWNLEWSNMLATCLGGERTPHNLYPLPENLSCDAHKNHVLDKSKGKSAECDGWILNPLEIPSHVNLFSLNKRNGFLVPNEEACSLIPEFPGNKHKSTKELINNTINVLNLNCDRLAELRREVIINIEKNIKTMRVRHVRREDVPQKLIERYFNEHWPEFFTTIRCCIPDVVEPYLKSISYAG